MPFLTKRLANRKARWFQRDVLQLTAGLGVLFASCAASDAAPGAASESVTASDGLGSVTNLAQVRQWLWSPAATNLPVDLEGQVVALFPEQSLVVLRDETGNAGIKLDLACFSFLKLRQIVHVSGLAQFGKGEASLLPIKLIDDDGLHSAQAASGQLYLSKGMHPISIRYFQCVREHVLSLEYEGPGTTRRKVPPEALFHLANPAANDTPYEPGLNFDYYEGFWYEVPDFRQLQPVRSGIAGDFSLSARRREDYFAFRFDGLLKIENPGEYAFYLNSDDGSQLFLQDVPTSVKVVSPNGLGQTNAPQLLSIGQPLAEDQDYLWSRIEGTVTFIGRTATGYNLEISSGDAQVNAFVNNSTSLPAGLVNDCRLCATGYCQTVLSSQRHHVLGSLLVPGTNDLSWRAVNTGSSSTDGSPPTSLPVLTTAAEIRQLKPQEAARAYPVRLNGILTARKDIPEGIIQDLDSAVYVRFDVPADQQPCTGGFYELTGVTGAGGFAALVVANQVTKLGIGQYPQPLHPDYAQLIGGSMDCLWVEVQGMVTRVGTQPPEVDLAVKGGKITALIMANGNTAPLDGLLNAFVRMRGCVIAGRNRSGQTTKDVFLWIPMLSCIGIVQPPPADPFQAPLKQVSDLSLFDPHPNYYQRTKVRGQILHVADDLLYFSDGTGSLRLIPVSPSVFAAGDLVEAVGLPELGDASPLLIEASIRKIGHTNLPPATPTTFEQLPNTGNDAHWVRIEGRLIETRTDFNHLVLVLQSGVRNLQAVAPTNNLGAGIPPLGSRLSLCGVIAQSQNSKYGNTGTTELLLNSLADITCLELPPFWTPARTGWAVTFLLSAVFLAGLWIYFLRRTVSRRTRALQLEMSERQNAEEKVRGLQTQRALEEQRARIARNIHDDLGARATKLSLLAHRRELSEADVQAHLEHISTTSRQIVEALDETVWAVNPVNDSLLRLANYIMHFAQDFFQGTGIDCQMDIPTNLPDLALSAEYRFNLFLVVKESLNNVLKHSRARNVLLQMRALPGQLEITIQDDGQGFDLHSLTRESGLANLKARVAGLGGQINIQSAPGQGTTICLNAPLSNPAVQNVK